VLQKLLVKVDELKASDLYVSVGLPATIKLNGRLESLTEKNLIEMKLIPSVLNM
jgi:twitching motility protein PilU